MPSAIILTHGHFDHVGAITELLKEWNVPVFAHPDEVPYLTGQRDYPKADPTVDGGFLAKISSIYPHCSINIAEVLQTLPKDGTIPGMPGWNWLHTPDIRLGHVSFFRPSDGSLVAGDAFVTVRADSFLKTVLQTTEVTGPPRYLTTDWDAAFSSVKKLRDLNPLKAITGHGRAVSGKALATGLNKLVNQFEKLALPCYGKYVPKAEAQLH